MAAEAIIELGDGYSWELGEGDLLGGSLTLAEGKEASSLTFRVADPHRQLANDLPLVLVEDVPEQHATLEVTFVAELGVTETNGVVGVEVPAGVEVIVDPLPGVEGDEVRFRTDEGIGPLDWNQPDPNSLRQAQATVSATAVDPGPRGNIAGGPQGNQPSNLRLALDLPGIDRVFNTAPATGGRNAGEKGVKVPVDCWLGPTGTSTPPKAFTGYLSQMTPSGPPGRLELMAVDRSADMRRQQRARSFNGTNVDELVRRLARSNGFDVDLSQADFGDVQLTRHVQHGATDWQFLNRVLSSVGHRVKVRGETVFVTKVGQVRDDPQTPVMQPADVSSYSFAVDELTTHTTPNVTAVSGAEASAHRDGTPAKARPTQLGRVGVPDSYESAPASISQQKARELQAEARQHRLFTATLEATDLYPQLDTDDMVVLQGWGRRYDGPWWIDSLTHSFSGETSFQLTSDSE